MPESVGFGCRFGIRHIPNDDVIVEKVININQHSRSQITIESVRSVFKLSIESIGSRRDLVANCVHTGDIAAEAMCIGLKYVCSEAGVDLCKIRVALKTY